MVEKELSVGEQTLKKKKKKKKLSGHQFICRNKKKTFDLKNWILFIFDKFLVH